MRHRAIWPLCLFLLLLCFAPLCRAAEPGSDTAQKLFLWKVSGPAGTVYLFGTIHVGRTDFYPLAPVIEASFKAADTLITEADLIESGDTDRLLKILLQKGTYPAGDSVENHIGQETRTHLLPYVEATQELASSYTRLKPWFLSIAITVIEAKRMGLNANDGLDRHFVDQATEMHKPIATLETAESQLELLNSFPEHLADQLLLSALLDVEHRDERMDQMLQAWRSGNADEMEKTKTRYISDYPSLKPVFEQMFDQRNDRMTQQIERFLQTRKTYFVAIGAGHLTGERGILSQLRGKNYAVEQLQDNGMRRGASLEHQQN